MMRQLPTATAAILDRLGGNLVVSCQAPPNHPLAGANMIAALCRCAAEGGAAGVRVNGVEGVRTGLANTELPVIGLYKEWRKGRLLSGGRPAITPTVKDAVALAAAGAHVVAFEATRELHGDRLEQHIEAVRHAVNVPLLADVSTLEEGVVAYRSGADLVGTTLSGYTSDSREQVGPDLALVAELTKAGVPTVAEGRIGSPDEAVAALRAGAFFVVVGAAITDARALTALFASGIAEGKAQR